jgi:FemAB-related protein (PEP-CTERM system-associated)
MQLAVQPSVLRRVGDASSRLYVELHGREGIDAHLASWETWFDDLGIPSLSLHPRWLLVLRDGLGITPFCLEARNEDQRSVRGLLPLGLTRSVLFGRYLVSLPYLNYGGVLSDDPAVAEALITEATFVADRLDVKHLQLRHEHAHAHWQLGQTMTSKVHMRLRLPATSGQLWDSFDPKIRNQVRKALKCGVEIRWGGQDLLDEFYQVFARNMRDLGTPVFGRDLFAAILSYFPDQSELCVAQFQGRPVAGAILIHGKGATEVPSASSLREHNHTNANMLMYWHLLERAVERGQHTFDFGRSSVDSGPHRFKKQWGAEPMPAHWQFYVRHAASSDARLNSRKYDRLVHLWQRLPVPVSRWIGPWIVRGIP